MNKAIRAQLQHKEAVTHFVDWFCEAMDRSEGRPPVRAFSTRLARVGLYPQSKPEACPSFLRDISAAFKVQFDRDMAAYLAQMQPLHAHALTLVLCHLAVCDIEFNDVITFQYFRATFPKFDMNVVRRMVESTSASVTAKTILRSKRESLLLTEKECDLQAVA